MTGRLVRGLSAAAGTPIDIEPDDVTLATCGVCSPGHESAPPLGRWTGR